MPSFRPVFFTTAEPGVVARPRGLATLAAAANATAADRDLRAALVRSASPRIGAASNERARASTAQKRRVVSIPANGAVARSRKAAFVDGSEERRMHICTDKCASCMLSGITWNHKPPCKLPAYGAAVEKKKRREYRDQYHYGTA